MLLFAFVPLISSLNFTFKAYRTGYVYRQPIIRSIDRNAIKEVEIPPTCSSYNQDPEYLKYEPFVSKLLAN